MKSGKASWKRWPLKGKWSQLGEETGRRGWGGGSSGRRRCLEVAVVRPEAGQAAGSWAVLKSLGSFYRWCSMFRVCPPSSVPGGMCGVLYWQNSPNSDFS